MVLTKCTKPALFVCPALLLLAACGSNKATPTPAASSPNPASTPSATATLPPTAAPTSPLAAVPGVLPSLTPIPLPSTAQISAPSHDGVWALVAGTNLFRSSDQGSTWGRRPLPSPPGVLPNISVSFVDAQHGWLLSPGSPATQCQVQGIQIWRTSDAGATWQTLSATAGASAVSTAPGIAPSQCKSDLSFVDSTHGFLSAHDPNSRPVIYRTSDGGGSWTASAPLPDPPGQQTAPGGFSLTPGPVQQRGSVLLLAANGFQHGYVYRSTDAGTTWAYVATVPGSVGMGDVAFLAATHWWASAEGVSTPFTPDAGATWQAAPGNLQFAAPIPPVLTFADAQVGYATVRGEIDRTTDGGQHWQRIQTPGTQQVP